MPFESVQCRFQYGVESGNLNRDHVTLACRFLIRQLSVGLWPTVYGGLIAFLIFYVLCDLESLFF